MLSFGFSVHICSPQRFLNHINQSLEASTLKCYSISGNNKKHILVEFTTFQNITAFIKTGFCQQDTEYIATLSV